MDDFYGLGIFFLQLLTISKIVGSRTRVNEDSKFFFSIQHVITRVGRIHDGNHRVYSSGFFG